MTLTSSLLLTGFEMVLVNTFNWDHVGKSLVIYKNSTPYILQPKLVIFFNSFLLKY